VPACCFRSGLSFTAPVKHISIHRRTSGRMRSEITVCECQTNGGGLIPPVLFNTVTAPEYSPTRGPTRRLCVAANATRQCRKFARSRCQRNSAHRYEWALLAAAGENDFAALPWLLDNDPITFADNHRAEDDHPRRRSPRRRRTPCRNPRGLRPPRPHDESWGFRRSPTGLAWLRGAADLRVYFSLFCGAGRL
jgi:hypothetical protein